MTRISPARDQIAVPDDEAAIARESARPLRWTSVLVWVLRIASAICMFRALSYWSELLGAWGVDFTDRPLLQQGAIVFFSTIYCFAAVGLWLAAAWGAAIWFITLIGEIVFLVLEPGAKFESKDLTGPIDLLGSSGHLLLAIILAVAYLAVSWLTNREVE